MKKLVLSLVICAAAFPALAQSTWMTDLTKARELATKQNKQILLNFTGSDWCGWCKKMKAETLDKPDFVAYATTNLVLVEVDFPNSKPQTAALKRSNAILKEKYVVSGYPTFVLIEPDGKELGRQVGYLKGGSDAFAGKIDNWLGKSTSKQAPQKPEEPKPKS
jgi:thioredoxin-related protein